MGAAYFINFILLLGALEAFRLGPSGGKGRRCSLRMDDELARPGIKEELTTRDEYLDERFLKLSSSGHDLTPMTAQEITHWKQERLGNYGTAWDINNNDETSTTKGFLGKDMKGLYVCSIGGLPMFSSGTRIDAKCTGDHLFFSEPCDDGHIRVTDWTSTSRSMLGNLLDEDEISSKIITCVRSGVPIGIVYDSSEGGDPKTYKINAREVRFLSLDEKWPVESQPENFWGTEGQYRSWNKHDLSNRPLSY